MSQTPLRIVILGGGTAGWMTANLFAHRWQNRNIEIVLVEAPDIGIIGVGEGSTPTLRRFFSDLGIAEHEWMPFCNATYKVNIKFNDWSPESGVASYSHPFISQLDAFSERAFYTNSMTRRLGLNVETSPDKFLFNGWLSHNNLAPITPPNFPFKIEYGYHFDSGLLGQFLCDRAKQHGVVHIQANVEHALLGNQGEISHLVCSDHENIHADFFVDCSGFESLLLQKTLDVEFESFKSNLFNDSAVVFPTEALAEPPVFTEATALSCGWAWRIPLTHRTGNGYVFASDFMEPEEAEKEFRHHLGIKDDVAARHLKMRVGQVKEHWSKNCLGLGLASGFIEPLEATALHLVQTTVEIFMDEYENGNFGTQQQGIFNEMITERFERVRDYIVAHYKLNTRTDTDYWRENRENNHLSESLLQILDVWFRKGDINQEIHRQQLATHFGSTSWHCLLAGYGAFPELAKKQPGRGDLYYEKELPQLFTGCIMNFQTHMEALQKMREIQ